MLPNAAPTALARLATRFFAFVALVAIGVVPALAGDRAAIDLIGYSVDGRYFAFEEFGIQDGSGFAYSNAFLIDLETDQWIKGTPIRVQADSEEESLQSVRAEVMDQLQPYLEQHVVAEPADMLVMIGDGEPDNDGTTLRFGAAGFMGPGTVQGDYRLDLESFDIATNANCQPFAGEPLRGFALSLTSEGKTAELHRDTTLPVSRRCPVTYRLYGVAAPFPSWSLEAGVAIISVYSHGFEGPDRRFMVVPLGL